jgi:N-acetylneuraminic acid mutarotase
MRILIAVILIFSSISVFAQNYWTQKASFGGLKRERGISFAVGNLGYMGMGEDTASIVHNDLWAYDPALDTWTQVASLPGSPRRNAISFVIDTLAYVGTGIDASESFLGNILKDFWEFNPGANTWTQKMDYPGGFGSGVYFATGFAVDSKGYICGGKIGPSSYVNDLWEYKPSANTWLSRVAFPGGVRYQHTSLVIGLKAYVGLGTDENVNKDDWWEYNPGTNAWIQMNDFAGSARASVSTFTIGNRGYVMLGSNGGFFDDLWEYNPWSDSWTIRASLPGAGRRNAGSFSINNLGYAGLGKGSGGIRQSFYEYTPILFIGIDESNKQEYVLNVFPNPFSESATVTVNKDFTISKYNLLNAAGQIVRTGDCNANQFTIEKDELDPGIYFIHISDETNAHFETTKIIIQ